MKYNRQLKSFINPKICKMDGHMNDRKMMNLICFEYYLFLGFLVLIYTV